MGGGWTTWNGEMEGSINLGKFATVWGGEIGGIEGALRNALEGRDILILTDSQAAVRKAGERVKARTGTLRSVIN